MKISTLFNPGLYKITCLKNKKVYIGMSSNVLSRLGRHSDNLEKQRHDCFELQSDFNRYGKNFFEFEMLNEGFKKNIEYLKQKELSLIKSMPKNLLYNSLKPSIARTARCVKINNQTYSSLTQAARCLNESRTHLTRKCNDKKNLNYCFISFDQPNANLLYSFKTCCPVKIDQTVYASLNQAARALGLHHKTIKNRVLSKKFPNYKFFTSIIESNDY